MEVKRGGGASAGPDTVRISSAMSLLSLDTFRKR